jgi:hypothetical protein
MRNLNLEASIWYLFTSFEFFEAAARECEAIVEWKIAFAAKHQVSPDRSIIEFTKCAHEFRHGAELARRGDYQYIWNISRWFYSDVRGMIESSPNNWRMDEAERRIFSAEGRLNRLEKFADRIGKALNNGLTKGESFLQPNPEYPERSDDDDGYPGDSIATRYKDLLGYYDAPSCPKLADPLPECVIDRSVACKTGDEVPWTGVWYPDTGLEMHSLTFAIEGLRMQPVFRVTKTIEELAREDPNTIIGRAETVAVSTTWHPVIPSGCVVCVGANEEKHAEADQPCAEPVIWQPIDPVPVQRNHAVNRKTAKLGEGFGLKVWRWLKNQ